MLAFVISARLAAAQQAADSVYSSAALRDLVAAVAAANHRPPPALQGYRSHIETELALALRDTLGREHAAEVANNPCSKIEHRTESYGKSTRN